MQEFIDLLNNHFGETTQLRYSEIIDILVDLNGVEMERIYDLTLVEADNYDSTQAIHALNTMLIESMNQMFLTNGIYLDEDELIEENIHHIFRIYEGVVRLDGWELYDDLLGIIDSEEQDNEDKFYSLLESVIELDEIKTMEIVDEVHDVFFEVIEEELLYVKKEYENKFDLDPNELRVYHVTPQVKAVLKTCNETCLVNEYIKAKKTFNVPMQDELVKELNVVPVTSLVRNIAIITLMQHPTIKDSTTLLSKGMDNVIPLTLSFQDSVKVSVGLKKIFKALEGLDG